MCVKCSVYDSLRSEPHAFDEDEAELATAYANDNDYGDSAYELAPFVDATYCDEDEENCCGSLIADGTGGTYTSLAEPQWRSSSSMFSKLKAILPLERQPIPVAEPTTPKGKNVSYSFSFDLAFWSRASFGSRCISNIFLAKSSSLTWTATNWFPLAWSTSSIYVAISRGTHRAL